MLNSFRDEIVSLSLNDNPLEDSIAYSHDDKKNITAEIRGQKQLRKE